MERRVIAAIALSIAILIAFRYYEERRLAQMAPAKPPVQARVQPPVRPAAPPAEELPKEVPQPEEGAPATAETEAAPERVVVEGDLYKAVLDNRGGVLASWELKEFKSSSGGVFEMIPSDQGTGQHSYPTSLFFDDPALTSLANDDHYSVEVSGGRTSAGALSPPATVVMRLQRGNIRIEKRFHFERGKYLVDFSATFDRDQRMLPARILLGQDIGPQRDHLLNPSIHLQAVADLAGKVERYSPPKDENEIRTVSGDVRWAGLDMQYFALLAIPARPLPGFTIQKVPVRVMGLEGNEVSRDLVRVTVPEEGSASWRLYIGPKMQSALAAVGGTDLSGVIDYGWFAVLVKPLLSALKYIDQYAHNFGYSIIILTFVLTLLLFPFRLKQMMSMKKMAVVQPKVKEIQEKYKKYKKTDPKRAEMNQEIMALYKEHKVNPLGGCLPLILQMPLLFAFYRLLASSIELRQAPFLGWIQDLSIKDPYYVLPIVMGVTMLISQKMTPMSPGGDQTQAKMMMFMPVIFTVMFLNVSAGLNLYFLCSNVFQITFQKIAERWMGDDKRKPAKPRK